VLPLARRDAAEPAAVTDVRAANAARLLARPWGTT
jgi:hypothetical protein